MEVIQAITTKLFNPTDKNSLVLNRKICQLACNITECHQGEAGKYIALSKRGINIKSIRVFKKNQIFTNWSMDERDALIGRIKILDTSGKDKLKICFSCPDVTYEVYKHKFV